MAAQSRCQQTLAGAERCEPGMQQIFVGIDDCFQRFERRFGCHSFAAVLIVADRLVTRSCRGKPTNEQCEAQVSTAAHSWLRARSCRCTSSRRDRCSPNTASARAQLIQRSAEPDRDASKPLPELGALPALPSALLSAEPAADSSSSSPSPSSSSFAAAFDAVAGAAAAFDALPESEAPAFASALSLAALSLSLLAAAAVLSALSAFAAAVLALASLDSRSTNASGSSHSGR